MVRGMGGASLDAQHCVLELPVCRPVQQGAGFRVDQLHHHRHMVRRLGLPAAGVAQHLQVDDQRHAGGVQGGDGRGVGRQGKAKVHCSHDKAGGRGAGVAQAVDGATIRINAPIGGEARIRTMGLIENIEIKRTAPPARVIVNARTGTVVINGAVRVGPAAVSHGKLTVRVEENPTVIQPAPLSRGETTVEQASDVIVEEERNPAFLRDKGASLSDIVKAINKLNVSPGDLVAILEALSQAGALSAELIVI